MTTALRVSTPTLAIAVVVFSALGCSHELSMRAPDFQPRQARVVLMPAMVALYAIQGDGDLAFDDSQSKRARVKVNGWLRFLAPTRAFRLADLREVSGQTFSSDAFYSRLDRLAKLIVVDDGRRPLAEYPLGNDGALQSWGTALSADYLGFVAFRGAYDTEARSDARSNAVLMGAVVGGAIGGAVAAALYAGNGGNVLRRGVLVIIDLRRNQLVEIRTVAFEQLDNPELQGDLEKLLDTRGS